LRKIATVVACIALIAPATALAQSNSSTCNAYNPQTCNVNTFDGSKNFTNSSTLPFTGLDVLLLTIGGGTLVGAGLVVRRVSRRIN
jgi:hypothetical protein